MLLFQKWKCLNMLSSSGPECSPLTPPLNGQLEPLQPIYIFRDHITLTCDPGYLLRQVRRRSPFICADKASDRCKIEINQRCFTSHTDGRSLSYRVKKNLSTIRSSVWGMGNGAVASRCVKVSLLTEIVLFSVCLFFFLTCPFSLFSYSNSPCCHQRRNLKGVVVLCWAF